MRMTVETVQRRVPVWVLAIDGDLDASNFEEAVAETRELYRAGARHLLLDLSGVPFMGSSGVVAIHSIAMLMLGEEPPDPDTGWQVFHTIGDDRRDGKQQRVKLLGPRPKVSRTLQLTGMDKFFEIFTDREMALASF
jgi:anti-anti-sigma regulatory factor